jgi:predicted deacylase
MKLKLPLAILAVLILAGVGVYLISKKTVPTGAASAEAGHGAGETLAVYGQVKLNANKVARAVPRFAGIVREARKALGDTVTAGEVVAIVETNQSLITIEVKAPIAGIDRGPRCQRR